MTALSVIIIYLSVVNIIGFGIMGIDKFKAKKGLWRIPESTLFLMAVIGGSIGSLLGMYTFHHKTRHWTFVYGMPAILIIQLLILFILSKAPLEFIFL